MEPGPDFVLRGHRDSVNCVKFLDQNKIVSGSGDGCIKVWDIGTRRAVGQLNSTDKSILSISRMANPTNVVSLSRDGHIRMWDLKDGIPTTPTLSMHCGAEHFCNACSDISQTDCNLIVSPALDESMVCVWDVRTATSPVCVIRNKPDLGMVTQLHYNASFPSLGDSLPRLDDADDEATQCVAESDRQCNLSYGPLLMAGFENGAICFYDIRMSCRMLCEKSSVHTEPIMALASSKVSPSIFTGSADSSLHLFKHVNEEALEQRRSVTLARPGTGCAIFRGDARLCVSGHWDGSTRIFSCKKLKPLAIMRHHQESVYAVDFATTGTDTSQGSAVFATGSKDCTIALWSVFKDV